jgi:DNA-directed RNA polymerase subunit RPC12/RpoP
MQITEKDLLLKGQSIEKGPFCPYCGTKLRLTGSFCAECGTRFEETDGEIAVAVKELKESAKREEKLRQVKEIMGNNFLGPERLNKCFNIQLTKEELLKIPFSDETLEECKDTHILFLGINHDKEGKPLTINRFREMFPADGQPKFYSYKSWYDNEKFATKETPEFRWYLIRKLILEESRDKTYEKQQKLLKENEEIERAVVYIYGMLLMFKATGKRLFEHDWVWCRDVNSGGKRVHINGFNSNGLNINNYWDDNHNNNLGLAPSRKYHFVHNKTLLFQQGFI